MRQVWIVGDIHGCLGALRALEHKLTACSLRQSREPFIVSVGDLVDRGPDSRGVVEHFISGVRAKTHAAIMGNHEMMMLRCLRETRPDLLEGVDLPEHIMPFEVAMESRPKYVKMAPRSDWLVFNRLMWLSQGGAETLESYGCAPMDLNAWSFDPGHLRFLAGLPTLWEDKHVVVTHALASADDLKNLRSDAPAREVAVSVMWNRKLPGEPPDPARVHVSGHSIQSRIKRCNRRKILRIDLGVYDNGRLAAYCPELDKGISVPSKVRWRRGH